MSAFGLFPPGLALIAVDWKDCCPNDRRDGVCVNLRIEHLSEVVQRPRFLAIPNVEVDANFFGKFR